jgi:hypothetical protein
VREAHEMNQLVGADNVRRAVNAAGAELRVFEPFNRKGLFADLA